MLVQWGGGGKFTEWDDPIESVPDFCVKCNFLISAFFQRERFLCVREKIGVGENEGRGEKREKIETTMRSIEQLNHSTLLFSGRYFLFPASGDGSSGRSIDYF